MNKEFLMIVGKHSKHWNYSKEETLRRLENWIENELMQTYKKAYIQGGIDAYNARYNALMDTNGVDDRRDDSAKSEVTID